MVTSKSPSEPSSLSLDVVLGVVASEDRRLILRYLRSTPDSGTTVDELVEYLANRANQGGIHDREHITIILHHR